MENFLNWLLNNILGLSSIIVTIVGLILTNRSIKIRLNQDLQKITFEKNRTLKVNNLIPILKSMLDYFYSTDFESNRKFINENDMNIIFAFSDLETIQLMTHYFDILIIQDRCKPYIEDKNSPVILFDNSDKGKHIRNHSNNKIKEYLSSTNFENDLELSQYIFGLQAKLISKIKYEITSQTISPREIVKLRYPMFTEEEIDQYFAT